MRPVTLAALVITQIGWIAYALAVIRMDLAVSAGHSLYVPAGSLEFETFFFAFLLVTTVAIVVRLCIESITPKKPIRVLNELA
jgi:hypothetical protein